MLIHKLSNNNFIIKYETNIDPSSAMYFIGNEKMYQFSFFIKDKIEKQQIGIQTYKETKGEITLESNYPNCCSWEDSERWAWWEKQFRKDDVFLYFYLPYLPENRMQQHTMGYIDISNQILKNHTANLKEELQTFKLNKYFVDEDIQSNVLYIEVDMKELYQCLTKSNIKECNNIMREFEAFYLDKVLREKEDNLGRKVKI